ncbi:MAG: enoyl-CoA hydratase/isomerase family protein [Gammaproteobacteria bacterium]|nr:enoyl-CoA hydratase/isomerase family protein [Gammaproteobacteria bacterium]
MSAALPSARDDATPPLLHIEGRQATIRLNRPAKLNRIEPADLNTLAEHLGAIQRNKTLRVLVLTGTGRVFSAGYHLGDLDERKAGRAQAPQTGATFAQVADALADCRVPTLCALNGSVYGGSTDLALACDFRIGITGSQMLMPAGKLGVHYYLSGMQRYVTRLGLNSAKQLFLLARPIDANEMLRIGYLHQAVAKEDLASTVAELAETLAGNAPLSLQNMKRALNQIAANDVDMEAFNAGYEQCADSDDLAEGLAAWKERRAPEFKGR